MPNDAVPVDPATLSLDLSTESATPALFRAAIGPVGANHYLPVFARFDLADRAGSGWNWAACLCTLGWMLFRRMWGAALLYVGVLVGVALLGAAVVGLVLEVAPQVQWGVGVALLMAVFVVPGVWGDAWLYHHCRKRMAGALSSSNWSQAAALLDREALRPSRAGWLALAYALVLGAGAALVVTLPGLPGPAPAGTVDSNAPRGPAPRASTPRLAQSTASPAASAVAAAVSAASVSPSASASASAPAPAGAAMAVATPASAPTPAMAAAAASAAAPVPVARPAPVSAPAASAAAAPTALASPASSAASRVAAPATTTPAPGVPATTASVAAVPARAGPAPRPPASGAAREPAPSASTPAPAASADTAPAAAGVAGGRYIVNIGLFAVEANASKAESALRGAGVTLLVQELQTSGGKRTRVRAGPYPSQAQAEAAADTVRALGLEAQVVRQPAQSGR